MMNQAGNELLTRVGPGTHEIDYASIRAVSFAYPREADWCEIDPYELREAAE